MAVVGVLFFPGMCVVFSQAHSTTSDTHFLNYRDFYVDFICIWQIFIDSVVHFCLGTIHLSFFYIQHHTHSDKNLHFMHICSLCIWIHANAFTYIRYTFLNAPHSKWRRTFEHGMCIPENSHAERRRALLYILSVRMPTNNNAFWHPYITTH